VIGQSTSHGKTIERLREDGMGAVYNALDTRLDRLITIIGGMGAKKQRSVPE
jgi:hypothetical protein